MFRSKPSQQYCDVRTVTSEQHVEMRDYRQSRDADDFKKLVSWLNFHSPYCQQTIDHTVHWHHWWMWHELRWGCWMWFLGNCSYVGEEFCRSKLKRNDKVKLLSSANKCFKIRDDVVPVNPLQLFNRMICIATTTSKFEEWLCYELTPYPTLLFDEVSLRKTAKSQLITVLTKYSAPTLAVAGIAADTYFVIDGGHLLHKVVWQLPAGKYADLYGQYCS